MQNTSRGDVAKIMEDTINEAVENKTYDNLETRNLIRDKVSKYLYKQTAKKTDDFTGYFRNKLK